MTEESFDERVPDALHDQRIDRIVAIAADVSRREAAEAIAGGRVVVDGDVVEKASQRAQAGQVVQFVIERDELVLAADPDLHVPVVFADDEVIVVNKPAGMVVHTGSGVRGSTMVNGLLNQYPELRTIGQPERPGIVHRLDRGTSGLLVVARTDRAYELLVEQLKSHTVERRYRALVGGHVEAESGLIDAPLGRSPRDATKRAVVNDGLDARTHYTVSERLVAETVEDPEAPPGAAPERYTLLICRLETGRTHQIRAHLAAIGHPVSGDTDYGGRRVRSGRADLGRPFLHAERLVFDHPATGERVEFDAPLTPDLDAVLSRLQPVVIGADG